jgi:phosphonate transport system substrate-binding protein
VPVVDGGRVYRSYVIVNAAGPYRSLADLRGRRFAYTDPQSNSGFLAPRYMLARMGEDPERFFSDTFFTHSHDKSIEAVARGQADGAAVDSLIWDWLDRTDPRYTRRTRIVARSRPYGIPPVVVRPGLDPGLAERLRTALLSLHRDSEAAVLLGNLGIERFAAADDSMYATVREMKAWLRRHAGAGAARGGGG